MYIFTPFAAPPTHKKAGSLVLPHFDSCQNMLRWGGEHVQLLLLIIELLLTAEMTGPQAGQRHQQQRTHIFTFLQTKYVDVKCISKMIFSPIEMKYQELEENRRMKKSVQTKYLIKKNGSFCCFCKSRCE